MIRLHPDTLAGLHRAVQLPGYERDKVKAGIVHLGLGAFHRAHQAVFTELAMSARGGDWGIIGVSLRSDRVSRQLLPQGCLYSVMSEDADGYQLRVIGAVRDVLVAPRQREQVLGVIADPAIHIITLTITEKGYCLGADGHSLDSAERQVAADLADPASPSSAIGILALGLQRRFDAGGAPLTLISCDNLSQNSAVLRAVLTDYVARCFPRLLAWLDTALAFPCSMVDRIVPAMDVAQKTRQGELLGLSDEGAVSTEPFIQWIIEDSFVTPRPDWESAGVQLVDDILPFEDIKLRLLNASHSAIAYTGLLAGHETVDQVMSDARLRGFVEQLMETELMPPLTVPAGFDLRDYRDQLLARFSNPGLGHRCAQIAMDGTEKIPQRWLATLQRGNCPLLARALGAWCCFILHSRFDIDDPRGGQLHALRKSALPAPQRVQEVLACARISRHTVADFDALCDEVIDNIDTYRAALAEQAET